MYNYSQIYQELARDTNNFKHDINGFIYDNEEEMSLALQVLNKHCKDVDFMIKRKENETQYIVYAKSKRVQK